ncbi:MAG: signal recognition particle subunit SRP19/SEC65 family protein, partial [Nitrososphaerales archaeon]
MDYFNSTLTREQGRRVPLDRSVKEPALDELAEATRRLGYNPDTV